VRGAGQGPGAGDPGGAGGLPAPGARPLTPSTLYVVSTPIGNLGDVTARAADVLRAADLVLCEDTRHSRRLLDHVGSRAPTTSVHEHNEARRAAELVERLTAGAAMALVSDAGTPLLSDPGARLVAAAIDAGVRVEPVPGASALLAALVASGLDATRFTFFGFLARKGRERRDALAEVAALRHTSVLYEAPGRAADTLADLAGACGPDRPAALARELTKQHEEVRRGTLAALAAYYADAPPRGEVVLVVAGAPLPAPPDPGAAGVYEAARLLRAGGAGTREVARALAERFGLSRNDAYRAAQDAAAPDPAEDAEPAAEDACRDVTMPD
jgi:16S rRNA (cytidine1402-2'-O)-methyltransferase